MMELSTFELEEVAKQKLQALQEAKTLPPEDFDEFREAINCCDTIKEITKIRGLISEELSGVNNGK